MFNKESNNAEVFNLCAVMELVGGYSELMNLPIPALKEIIKYIEFINKESTKGMKTPRMKR